MNRVTGQIEPEGWASLDAFDAVFPIPHPALNPNARMHWAKRSPYFFTARMIALNVARSAYTKAGLEPPGWGSVAVLVTVNWGKDREPETYWDTDNVGAAMKASLDGLTDAGILTDDRVVWDWRVTAFLVDGLSGVNIQVRPETPHHGWKIERLLGSQGTIKPVQPAPGIKRKPNPKYTYPKGTGR